MAASDVAKALNAMSLADCSSSSSAAATSEGPRFRPEEVLAALQAVPEAEATFTVSALRGAYEAQSQIVDGFREFSAQPPSLEDVDRILMLFLKNVYLLVSSAPGALAFDALEDLIARSGLLTPFCEGMQPDGQLILGVPTSDNVVCDSHQVRTQRGGGRGGRGHARRQAPTCVRAPSYSPYTDVHPHFTN
jgi:hypothetical protein